MNETRPWAPDARLTQVLEHWDTQTERDLPDGQDVVLCLYRLGWFLLGEGETRRVYAHPEAPVVLKLGNPDSNRSEQQASLRGDVPAIPCAWLSPGGRSLAMFLAEDTLVDALNTGRISRPAARRVLDRLEVAGGQDVRLPNVGFWQGEWRMLDLGQAQ